MKQFVDANEPLRIKQSNPKSGKSAVRYESYKRATTCSEFLAFGGGKDDLKNDLLKGHVDLASGPWRNDPRVTRQQFLL